MTDFHRYGNLTVKEVAARDTAIRQAIADGGSWAPLSLGIGERFSRLLTYRRSPLEEPLKPQVWSTVFRRALKANIIEHTGRWRQARCGLWKPEYRLTGIDTTPKKPNKPTSVCQHCGEAFTPTRSDARYCGSTCRQRAHREAKRP